MLERARMVISMIKELHGPQLGPREQLPAARDPRSEYITGVLAPELTERPLDIEAEIDEVIEEVGDEEDQGSEGVVITSASIFSPALDPKAQPRSLGLSFVVEATSKNPRIDICATWARYEEDEGGNWVRCPQFVLFESVLAQSQVRLETDQDVYLHLRSRPYRQGQHRISLYLVNNRVVPNGRGPETNDFVFQPQIRVHCTPGTVLTAIDDTGPDTFGTETLDEDVQLTMLYRNRRSLARGHMCGAVWRAIDPERPCTDAEIPDAAPFVWTDRSLIPEPLRSKFSPADVRTEFFPSYSIEAPEWAWDEQWGEVPESNPLILAETWEVADIRRRLEPLVLGYNRWIESELAKTEILSPRWQTVARNNLHECQRTSNRIQEGIDWLVRDVDVRLAFCFANQAIALQSQWSRQGVAVHWRTFQLAFILLNISGLADPFSDDRSVCDLLWFPTGGGKTEAYLGLSVFTLALRRRRAAVNPQGDSAGRGVSVLSRYTLRLLTIQQFRRALGVITACEVLRVKNLENRSLPAGWRPQQCSIESDFLWGGTRFSAGLWVGGGVTPNSLNGFEYRHNGHQHYVAGAVEILRGVTNSGYDGPDPRLQRTLQFKRISAEGEPAQVLTCPVCQAMLAIPEEGLSPGSHTLHFVYRGETRASIVPSVLNSTRISVDSARISHHGANRIHTLSVSFTVTGSGNLRSRDVDHWWQDTIAVVLGLNGHDRLLAARPARPGYFLTSFTYGRNNEAFNGFDIYCPNPHCELNDHVWAEQVPIEVTATTVPSGRRVLFSSVQFDGLPEVNGLRWQAVEPEFRTVSTNAQFSERIPITAYTVDDQIYHRCPSLVIATVDKFARLAFEPKAGALFGNVTHYHARWGYYRAACPPDDNRQLQDQFSEHLRQYQGLPILHVASLGFQPPDLIIQDELHLIEGPLGSLVGLYETAIDVLCEYRIGERAVRPKYIASTATVRQAEDQVQSLFNRRIAQFPPSALDVDDRFFARTTIVDAHPLDSRRPGRLYVGVAAPGKGAQTPIVRTWSVLLQTAQELRNEGETSVTDGFWTLVGYFNALRELAGAYALYRQDIRERLSDYFGTNARQLSDQALELSSRANSLALPELLQRLAQPWNEDAVLATSMFGTGVDVERLGLMVVHGQPKTTSSYIQATGRVGRRQGALVVTFFRVTRPRDLDHYEYFTGYHRMLYRAVEPVTVTPFAPRARERGLGPVALTILRHARFINGNPVLQPWYVQQRLSGRIFSRAALMATHRRDTEVNALADLAEQRAMCQPEARRPTPGITNMEMASELDLWQSIARDVMNREGLTRPEDLTDKLVYNESSMLRGPERAVVLGDAQHQLNGFPVAFENAPTSLRDVEVTTQFKG